MTRAYKKGKNPNYTVDEKRQIFIQFLKGFKKYGSFSPACEYAAIKPNTMRKWLKDNEKWQEKFEEIQEEFVDKLEMVAIERAIEKSDSLMALLLRANRPSKYKEQVKVDADVNSRSQVNLVFSKEEWDDDAPNFATGENVDGDKA